MNLPPGGDGQEHRPQAPRCATGGTKPVGLAQAIVQLVLTEAAVARLGEGVEHVQIGFNAKSRVVGIRSAAAEVRGALKLRAQPNGRSRLVDAKRFFAHRGLALDKARGLEVEDFGGGIVGFRLPEEGAGEAEAPAQVPKGGRRKAASA